MTDQNREEGTSQAGPDIPICPRKWGARAPQVHGASSRPAPSPPGTGPPWGRLPPVGSRSLTGGRGSMSLPCRAVKHEIRVGLRMTGAKQHPSHKQLMEARTHVTFKDADLRTNPEPLFLQAGFTWEAQWKRKLSRQWERQERDPADRHETRAGGRQALLLGRDGDCPHGWGARPPEPASRPPLLEGHGTSTGLEGHALDSRGSAQVAAALAARRGRPPTPLTPPHSDTAVWCLSNLETFSDFKTLFIHRGYESLSLLIKLFLLTFLN